MSIPRALFVGPALATMRCDYCRTHAALGDQPQPGWIGSEYQSDRDVVVLLQNPGAAPRSYSNEREASVQQLLKRFTEHSSEDSYADLADFMLADMTGGKGGSPWAKWTHPVSKLVISPQRLAWINVVKFRTPGELRKDDPVTSEAVSHGVRGHLPNELRALNPRAVVAIGAEARKALAMLSLPAHISKKYLKLQGSSNSDVAKLRTQIGTS